MSIGNLIEFNFIEHTKPIFANINLLSLHLKKTNILQ